MTAKDYEFRLKHMQAFLDELDDIQGNYDMMIETLMGWAALAILEPYAQYKSDDLPDVQARVQDAANQMLSYTKGLYESVYKIRKEEQIAEMEQSDNDSGVVVVPFSRTLN